MVSDDVPTHLITAAVNAYRAAQQAKSKSAAAALTQVTAAVLAALRPEDAHLVPAIARREDAWEGIVGVLKEERDEARAEVERLRNHLEIARGAIGDGGRSG